MPKNQIKNLNNFISDNFLPDYGKQRCNHMVERLSS
jgi:hypothetical protein